MYNEAEAQIASFVDKAAQLAPSTKEVRKYCSRSSAKFDDGFLSCTIEGLVQYDKLSSDDIRRVMMGLDNQRKGLKWTFVKDNTENIVSTPSIMSVMVYDYKGLSCDVSYEYKRYDTDGKNFDKETTIATISCTGSALKEHYK